MTSPGGRSCRRAGSGAHSRFHWPLIARRGSATTSTPCERVLSRDEIATFPSKHGLSLTGVQWIRTQRQHAHQDEPWRTLTLQPAKVAR
jgi:hypothetical protein